MGFVFLLWIPSVHVALKLVPLYQLFDQSKHGIATATYTSGICVRGVDSVISAIFAGSYRLAKNTQVKHLKNVFSFPFIFFFCLESVDVGCEHSVLRLVRVLLLGPTP